MHKRCFDNWEQNVLNFLRTCGRARSWSEKQRMQNLWTKKGYDLAFRVCACVCGRGHVRKDLTYFPPDMDGNRNRRKGRKRHEKDLRTGGKPLNGVTDSLKCFSGRRYRHISGSSCSSNFSSSPLDDQVSLSPPSGTDFPPLNEEVNNNPRGGNGVNIARGNIFSKREAFNEFTRLHKQRQNSYFIHMEDTSCNGNEDIKSFVLTQLTAHKAVTVSCLVCSTSLPVYDHFPLIDGTFFLSPICHDVEKGYPVRASLAPPPGVSDQNVPRYLHAVCMYCLEKAPISCKSCHSKWSGEKLIIGSMYSYDIFAAAPCCYHRLSCNQCHRVALNNDAGCLPYFSQYSRRVACPHCQIEDYHFVKKFSECYITAGSNTVSGSAAATAAVDTEGVVASGSANCNA